MVISNIIGGLGNQMFQYACGRAHALRTGSPLLLGTQDFQGYSLHNGLEICAVFELNCELASHNQIKDLLRWRSNRIIRKVASRAPTWPFVGGPLFVEPAFQYCPEIRDVSGNVFLQGYWQSEAYFAEYANIIRDDFKFAFVADESDLDVLRDIRSGPSVSLHVRRGDYKNAKNNGLFADVPVKYYFDAVSSIRRTAINPKVFIFSDDPAWCSINLLPVIGDARIVDHNTGPRSARDMWLMSACDDHIIANSSFSWWAAWLGAKASKRVIGPRNWFGERSNNSSKNLFPDSWEQM